MSTPEGLVKAKVKKAFDALPSRYRFMPVQNGMGKQGLDFFCCVLGRFFAIETKAPGKKLTPRQRLTCSEITDAGGVVFVIRTQDDVDDMMVRLLMPLPPDAGTVYDTNP